MLTEEEAMVWHISMNSFLCCVMLIPCGLTQNRQNMCSGFSSGRGFPMCVFS